MKLFQNNKFKDETEFRVTSHPFLLPLKSNSMFTYPRQIPALHEMQCKKPEQVLHFLNVTVIWLTLLLRILKISGSILVPKSGWLQFS